MQSTHKEKAEEEGNAQQLVQQTHANDMQTTVPVCCAFLIYAGAFHLQVQCYL